MMQIKLDKRAPRVEAILDMKKVREFEDNISTGLGYIDPDDVLRQWFHTFHDALGPVALAYLICELHRVRMIGTLVQE